MKYKYWSQYLNRWVRTNNEITAKNASYQYHKPYYKKITGKWYLQQIPDSIDLSNTDTFHCHETKGRTRVAQRS